MAPKSKMLSREEFVSLLTVGNTCAVLEPPAVIAAEHRARLIALGYMVDLSGIRKSLAHNDKTWMRAFGNLRFRLRLWREPWRKQSFPI